MSGERRTAPYERWTMKIGLIDVDGHNFPNLALMKISAYHKSQGDNVDWWMALDSYDRVYMSKVFDQTYTKDIAAPINAEEVVKGGTGYGLDNKLPDEIEHCYPDYSLYPELTRDKAYGFLTRGCPRGCDFCIVADKEGRKSVKVADLSEFWRGQREIVLLDPNILACKERMELLAQLADSGAWVDFTQGLDARLLTETLIDYLNAVKTKRLHFAWDKIQDEKHVIRGLKLYKKHGKIKDAGRLIVYTITNYGTTLEEDLYRIYKLRDMGYYPYVMVYDKPNADEVYKRLQRWCNNRWIFKSCAKFEDYRRQK